jgi:protease IV
MSHHPFHRPPLVLAIDLARGAVDPPPATPFEKLAAARRPTLRDVLEAVEHAAADARVRALLVRLGQPAADWATASELRDAVVAFRASGKPAIAHAESFGEFADANVGYLVASGFDEICLQPSGAVQLTGVAREVPFLRGVLAKLGVEPEFDSRHEYKSAKNLFTETGFTEAHREAEDRMVESLHEVLVAAIADGRGVAEARARELIDGGPYLGAEAVRAGLIDRLCWRDEVVADIKKRAGDGAEIRTLTAYLTGRRMRPSRSRPTVALIHGVGAIRTGRSRPVGPLGPAMGSDTVVGAFRQAVDDSKVKAILFRVNSPGGSAVASDSIWREVVRARAAGKPVVVSMGAVAASGGYWVSMAADRIIALPGTITGSIGVVVGKFVTTALRERLGLSAEPVERGERARMHSNLRGFADGEWERIGAFLDHIYDDFVTKVADGRRLDRERVHEIARGRVWTGADALRHGLVDRLGGYAEATAAVRELLRLAPDARLHYRRFPKPSLAERLGFAQPELADTAAGLLTASSRIRASLGDAGIVDAGVVRCTLRSPTSTG